MFIPVLYCILKHIQYMYFAKCYPAMNALSLMAQPLQINKPYIEKKIKGPIKPG